MKVMTLSVLSLVSVLSMNGCLSPSEDANTPTPETPIIDTEQPVENREPIEIKEPEITISATNTYDGLKMPLDLMEEAALDKMEPFEGERFRFIWLRSFDKPYLFLF